MKESQNVKMEGGLIDTALRLSMPNSTAAIFYMDFTQEEDQMETSSESFPMSRLDLKMFTRHVQAEEFRVSSDVSDEQFNDMLTYHNINAIEATYNANLKDKNIKKIEYYWSLDGGIIGLDINEGYANGGFNFKKNQMLIQQDILEKEDK